jgi:hypothetical protein
MRNGRDVLDRVNGHLRRRECKDQPSMAYVNVRKSQDIPKECPIGFRVTAVDQHVRPGDQRLPPFFSRM